MTANRRSIGSDLAKVDAYRNTSADYEDIPEITDEDFARATPHDNGKPLRGRPPIGGGKQQVALRIDRDVIAVFRAGGPGWQSRINGILRKAAGLKIS